MTTSFHLQIKKALSKLLSKPTASTLMTRQKCPHSWKKPLLDLNVSLIQKRTARLPNTPTSWLSLSWSPSAFGPSFCNPLKSPQAACSPLCSAFISLKIKTPSLKNSPLFLLILFMPPNGHISKSKRAAYSTPSVTPPETVLSFSLKPHSISPASDTNSLAPLMILKNIPD